jgi:hypothetical protein
MKPEEHVEMPLVIVHSLEVAILVQGQ